ncbi:MAG: PorT family protein [Cyclobacteriaceae bacterium]|nr:PorT family protein [Cyclobacteriaceae bacterium]
MKRITLVLVILCSAYLSFAQLSGGAKAGINLASMYFKSDDQTETTDMVIGFQLGGYLNYKISETFIFQPELVFSRLGGKESEYDPNSQEEIDVQFKLNYLAVPLNFKFQVNENFGLLVGPQIGFMVGAKAKVDFFGSSVEVDVKDQFKGIDFGGNIGLSYTINKLGFDARYYLGFSNIGDFDEDIGDGKIMNRAIQLSVYYQLFSK